MIYIYIYIYESVQIALFLYLILDGYLDERKKSTGQTINIYSGWTDVSYTECSLFLLYDIYPLTFNVWIPIDKNKLLFLWRFRVIACEYRRGYGFFHETLNASILSRIVIIIIMYKYIFLGGINQ